MMFSWIYDSSPSNIGDNPKMNPFLSLNPDFLIISVIVYTHGVCMRVYEREGGGQEYVPSEDYCWN